MYERVCLREDKVCIAPVVVAAAAAVNDVNDTGRRRDV